ncbi:MAG: PEP-CTERM sorting domain-containing protein [Isosphaeraceae bacterium]
MKTRRRTATIAGVLMGLAMLAAATPQANAGFLLVWEPNQSTTQTWDYSAFFNTQLDPGTRQPVETLLPSSYVTLYDFGGYKPGSLKINPKYASEFKITEQNTGITPKGISVPDSKSLPNFTATYTGKALTTSTSFIDLFTLNTTFTGRTPGGSNFSGLDFKSSGPSSNTPVALFGYISTPTYIRTPTKADPLSAPSVPEPGSLLLLGLGSAIVFGGAYQCRKLSGRNAF